MYPSDWIDVGLIVSVCVNVVLGLGWLRSSRRALRLEERQAREIADPRIDELHHIVTALADQMDQVASGQEFLDRVLVERLGKLPASPARPDAGTMSRSATTPH